MSTFSQTIILGSVGQDPDIRTFADGGKIANLSIATSEKWKDKQTGEQQERTEWHRVVLRGKLADLAEQYVKKGDKIQIVGQNQTRKWTNSSGAEQYTTEIVARTMTFISKGKNHGQSNAPQQQRPAQAPAPAPVAPSVEDDWDDDIPF